MSYVCHRTSSGRILCTDTKIVDGEKLLFFLQIYSLRYILEVQNFREVMIMVLWYKNSFLASVVSILGCILVIAGLGISGEGDLAATAGLIICGIPLIIWGKVISNNKAFKKWWKQVTDANLEPQIAQNVNTAITIYNKNPQKRTLKKIAALNPAAAAQIQNSIKK